MAALILTCLEADYDAATGVCAAPFYSVDNGGWFAMPLADAQEIAVSIALLWAVAWTFRMARKALQEIG